MSDGLKALKYAEENLGVNRVYGNAIDAHNDLSLALTKLTELRDKKRGLEHQLMEQEMLVASDEWGKHPEMSAARMESHLKVAKAKDPILKVLKDDLRTVATEIELAENDKSLSEADIKIAVGRMHELGGYLAYLAVVKSANEANSPDRTTST